MKKVVLFGSSMLLYLNTFAAPDYNSLQNFTKDWIIPLFPVIIGATFLIGAMINLPHVLGENRDIKKFFVNIFIFVAAVMTIVGLYTAITGTNFLS
jgi:hypothetical protein